jgi:hypothetical protein
MRSRVPVPGQFVAQLLHDGAGLARQRRRRRQCLAKYASKGLAACAKKSGKANFDASVQRIKNTI